MDGYDKLKPYGFAINGCIDGFSRYIVWMEAYTTNDNPKVIADYFISLLAWEDARSVCVLTEKQKMGTLRA